METYWAIALGAAGAVALAGFVAGLFRPKRRDAPFIAITAVVAGYVGVVALAGGWYAACSDCTSKVSYDSTRIADLWLAMLWGAVLTVGIIIAVYAGMAISALYMRFSR